MQIRFLLALSLLPAFSHADLLDDTETGAQCSVEPPVAIPAAAVTPDSEQLEIRIESDSSDATMNQRAQFDGNVSFSQGSRRIAADKASVDYVEQRLDASGQLVFQDSMFTVTADALTARMQDNSATLSGASYWLHGQQVHGEAKRLEITPDNNLQLSRTSFTTCPPDNVSWMLEADRIKIDSKEEWGEIWNAKLRIADVPVFYIPYMTVPVSDKRKTGFLFPEFSTSTTNGLEFATPWYWNLAPEYDLTLTPHYMSSRGLFLKSEFRYLAGDAQAGQLNLEYLGNDHKLDGSPDRYLYHWQHQGALDTHWRVLANFTQVSDNNYFNDLKSEVARATDNQLSRIGEVSYFEQDWDISTRVQDIKVLGEEELPYRVMPQLNFNYRANDFWQNLDFGFNAEASNFQHQQDEMATANRLHLQPSVTWPIHGPAGFLSSELTLLQTNYWQHNLDRPENQDLDETVSRTIPRAKIHGQINFERNTSLFDSQMRQTLEPQFQYLYVGYEDQSHIGLYDTAQLQDDYYGLFRARRFSGWDRIADANQMTLGLTTRLFDEHNLEQMKFSFGQIFYFTDSKVALSEDLRQERPSASVLAAELDTRIYKDWFFSGAIQYDTHNGDTRKSEFTLDFRPEANKLVQFSYRYVPDLLNSNTNDRVDISQTGLRTTWPLRDDLYFVGNWYYDLKEARSVEAYTGFQYESCCWAVRLSYHYHIKTNYSDEFNPSIDEREQFERGIFLNFVIKGLGGSGPLGVSDMLDEGLFNYRKPLYLRN
ncbi:LPS assembly protein LptD [Shewanella cyperi]|uniref:LPS-assembly protein LptD n=1 Tax=Shewanella cyperi TaxID=2814292 RepID=A0A975ALY1_9GAMM|nr:LPS assembly protein LptD [Shewanella cyperi]QSX30693.1 LPS assembly protein LptD [Shewanella cyperi]QSX41471.1 LPS assembly protein LptD [Shewanella cyperi]